MRKITVKVDDPNKYISTISVTQNRDMVLVYVDATAVGKRKVQDCMHEDKNVIRIFNHRTKESTIIQVKNVPFRQPIIRAFGGKYSLFILFVRRHKLGERIVYSKYED